MTKAPVNGLRSIYILCVGGASTDLIRGHYYKKYVLVRLFNNGIWKKSIMRRGNEIYKVAVIRLN